MTLIKKVFYLTVAAFGLLLTFGSEGAYDSNLSFSSGETITLSHTSWDDGLAGTYVIEQVLESEGFEVETVQLDPAVLFSSIATGDSDITVSPWMPLTHGAYYERYKANIDVVGPHTTGAITGLVVPSYMEVDSIANLSDEAGQVITGIEPGAGIAGQTAEVLETYSNLAGWEQQLSSTGAMLTELGQAISNKEEIIITGWNPHWMFIDYDLKYLEDPEGVYGDGDNLYKLARTGFSEENPRAYEILENFEWDIEEIESIMLAISDGVSAEEAASHWIKENPEQVAAWLGE